MEIFRGFVEEKRNVLTVERVLSIVSEHFDVSVPDLLGKRRFRAIAHPRSVAMYLCRKHVQASFPQLGREFGGKDHSTIFGGMPEGRKGARQRQAAFFGHKVDREKDWRLATVSNHRDGSR